MTSDNYLLVVLTLFYGTLIYTWNSYTYGFFFDSELQICDGTHLRKYRKSFCPSKLVFTSNSTKVNSDCICASGIWLLINRNCVPSTIVSEKGCFRTPQVKAMQYLGALEKDDFFAVITESESNFAYKLLRPVQNVIASGAIWIYNGKLARSDNGSFCAGNWQMYNNHTSTTRPKEIRRYTVYGKLTVQYECAPYYTELIEANLRYALKSPATSECKINCLKQSSSKLVNKKARAQTDFKSASAKTNKRKLRHGPSNPSIGVASKNTTGESAIAIGVNSITQLMHRRFLLKMLSYGFSKDEFGMDSEPEYRPPLSFMVLEKLKDVVYKTCAGRVSRMFLEFALVIFRIAYETRGTDLVESLDEKEAADIMQFLNECQNSITPLHFNKGDILFCPDELIDTVEKDEVTAKVTLAIDHTENVYLEKRHLSIEAPWNMIDLTVGACIGAFAESYILYHKMEQALEKLFIKDLKILWIQLPKRADVFYTRIYGPNWRYNAENLERCVQSVYISNPKLSRLRRPVEKQMEIEDDNPDTGHIIPGYHKPIEIPEITIGKRKADASAAPKLKERFSLTSVNLTCQAFNALQCYYP